PDAVRCVGTSTLRVARNAAQFIAQAERALGHPIEIVAGREEARLIYLGVAHSLPASPDRRLVIDIGGGSTELIVGHGLTPHERESLHMGCVNFSQRFFAGGALGKAALKTAEMAARVEVERIGRKFSRANWQQAIGSSGTARALRDLLEQNGWSTRGITADGLARLRAQVAKAGHVDALQLAGLARDRRPVIAGGFAIMADTELPIHVDLATAAGRQAAGFGDEAAFQGTTVLSFRVSDGDDASCLNLQQPQSPRIVGLPPAFIERGGFAFSQTVPHHGEGDPWRLLDGTLDDGSVPVVGDEASVRWILKSGLNRTITVPGANGPVTLRIVGLLRGSLWQSELLMSERNLTRFFGDGGGYRRFLVEAAPQRQAHVMAALREGLEDAGIEVRRTADVLSAYAGVQNTYLAAFQALGGLGLVLGTFAVATVLLRNIVERRGELGLMLALGFTRRQVVRLVAAETVVLIAAGLAIGTVAGLLAAAPHMVQAKADVPWLQLGGTMAGIMALAIAACVLVTQRAVGPDLLAAIRSE
ncbi:MAG TPA: FtsX-like permease family protein, partial [Phycisphaerae bacterium]|nr:FtsX-like permease family protein [Phycisphaerae bacterium]